MIPGVMVHFLERATVAVASTRTADLLPRLHFLSGWKPEEDGDIVLCLVAEGYTDGLMESLVENGEFSMTAEVIGPHETYQFKGSYAGSRPLTEQDAALHRDCQQRFVEAVQRHHPGQLTDAQVRAHIPPPAVAVRLRVRSIYEQTPGPGAGGKLYPQERR